MVERINAQNWLYRTFAPLSPVSQAVERLEKCQLDSSDLRLAHLSAQRSVVSKAGDDQRSAKRMVLARWSLRGLAFWMYNQTMFAMNRMTLRLIMPQWQGGNVHNHFFGSQRLAWLAPAASEIILGLGLRKRRQK